MLFIVKSNKKIDVIEIIKPNIIKGFDFSPPSLVGSISDEDFFSLSLLIRFEKGLITFKNELSKSLVN